MTKNKQPTPGKQVAGFLLCPDWANNPSLSDEYITEMAIHGYCAAILFIRHMHKTVWDQKVHDCVKHMTEHAHHQGIKFILDTDHKWWGQEFVEDCPEAIMKVFGSYSTTASDGEFEFRADYPRLEGICIIDDVVALFLKENGEYRQVANDSFTYEWQNYGLPKPGVLVRGKLNNGFSGELQAYVSFRSTAFVDVANPKYLQRQKELLDFYQDVPLDGFGWDEPGKGMGQLDYFKAGDAFLELFKTTNGYDLTPRLICLDYVDDDPETVKVRCDYYRTLNDMNLTAQQQHNDYARKLFGEDLILGTHQTWSGIPTDLAAGCIDYFRLGKILTAAWTDGSWSCELKFQAFHHLLADGIRNELGLSDAYYNDWTKELPTIEDMHFTTRYKMLFHVNWFNIFFSHFSENEVNFRLEPLRSQAIADVEAMDEFDRLLNDEFYAQSDIAWLYSWEGIAGAQKWLARCFYTCNANVAQHLADSGLFASMIGPESIAQATISGDSFTVNGQTYKTLLVIYGNVLSVACYEKIIEMAKAGIPVVFVGPQPEYTSDQTKNIAKDFAKLMGIEPVTFSKFQTVAKKANATPKLNEWEPEWIDFVYPAKVNSGKAIMDSENKLLAVKSPKLSLYYLPSIDPREDLINILKSINTPKIDTFAENAYVRLFQNKTNPQTYVVLTVAKGRIADAPLVPDRYTRARPPRKYSTGKAIIRLESGELEIKNCTWSASLIDNGKLLKTIGDAENVNWKINK